MIPTILAVGILAGLLRLRLAIISVLCISVVWAGVLFASDITNSSAEFATSALLALLNASVAAGASHLGMRWIRRLTSRATA